MPNQLTKENWLHHGLETLAKKGFGALKAEPLAKSLKVSRGSFYWHFKSIEEFQSAVLSLWRHRATLKVIEEIDRLPNGSGRLGALVRRAFNSDRDLERAVRAWATRNTEAAKVVNLVDSERINYISDLLVAQGVSGQSAQSKSIFLYWAYLGQVMIANGENMRLADAEFEKIVALFHS